MKRLLLLTLLSMNIHAADDCATCTPPKPSGLKSYDEVQKEIEQLQSVVSVSCVDVLKVDANQEYKENFSALPLKTAVVKGLKLQGSAEELSYLGKMLGENPSDEWQKAKSCSTVLCALTKVYDSEEAAQRSLNIAKRNGYIVSIAKDFTLEGKRIGQLFKLEELQVIDLAYKKLPPTFKRLTSLDRIKRLPNGLSSPRAPNAAAYASPGFKSSYFTLEGEITFLEGAFITDKSWGPHTAIHELSHHFDFTKSLAGSSKSHGISETPAYLKLSGWVKTSSYKVESDGKKTLVEKWEHAKDKKFVTNYASTQPGEDLGESSSYYVYEPNKLKAIDPEKYEFIKKNLYGGKEYINEPDFDLTNEEILKRCMQGSRGISLFGKEIFPVGLSSDCLDSLMKEQKFTDPKYCNYNKDQIKNYLFDKIADSLKSVNASLKKCDANLEKYKKECFEENNFQKACSLKKCNLNEALLPKVSDVYAGSRIDADKIAMESIKAKMGESNFLVTVLKGGLDRNDISINYSLTGQKYFLEGAAEEIKKFSEKEGYQFDSSGAKDEYSQRLQWHFIMNKKTSKDIENFQEMVLKKSTKSKEKNLELIKDWAASQSFAETPQFDDLAETLSKYAKKWSFGR